MAPAPGLIALLGALILVACAPAAEPIPSSLAVSEASVPDQLRAVSLPDSAEEVEEVFRRLPERIGDVERSGCAEMGPERFDACYSSGSNAYESGAFTEARVLATDISTGGFFPPDFTAGDVIAGLVRGGDLQLTASGADEDLAWLQGSSSVGDAGTGERWTMYIVTWGRPDGSWVFAVEVADASKLEPTLAVFLEAIRGG